MKKAFLLILCFALVTCLFSVTSHAEDENLLIYETPQAPEIDGKLDVFYPLVADSTTGDKSFILNAPDTLRDDTKFYACWNNGFLYTYVQVPCNDEHIAYMDNETEHFIFNAHYLMTAICPDDPTKEEYVGTNTTDGGWEWGALFSANYMYEWTTILDSRNGDNVISEHFGQLTNKNGFEFCVVSEDGYDCYEQKIPLKLLATSKTSGIESKVGSVFGFGFTAGLTDVGTGYAETKDKVSYSGYFDDKTIIKLIKAELASDIEPTESSVDESSEAESSEISEATSSQIVESSVADVTSETVSSQPQTQSSVTPDSSSPQESDDFPWLWVGVGVLAAGAIAAVVIILLKRRK